MFPVENQYIPCTRGVDLAPLTIPLTAFDKREDIQHISHEDDKCNSRVGFIDVEGQGAEDCNYDSVLALPVLLSSGIVIYNHKGAPVVNDILNKIGVIVRGAESVLCAEEREDKNLDQCVIPPGRFGHLHIVFRDFSHSGDEAHVRELLLTREKLVKNDGNSGEFERNAVRDLIERNFQSITIWLLRSPSSMEDLAQYRSLPERLVRPEFIRRVLEIHACICNQLKQCSMTNEKPRTHQHVYDTLVQVVDTLNKSGGVNLKSLYRSMDSIAIHKEMQQYEKNLLQVNAEIQGNHDEVEVLNTGTQELSLPRSSGSEKMPSTITEVFGRLAEDEFLKQASKWASQDSHTSATSGSVQPNDDLVDTDEDMATVKIEIRQQTGQEIGFGASLTTGAGDLASAVPLSIQQQRKLLRKCADLKIELEGSRRDALNVGNKLQMLFNEHEQLREAYTDMERDYEALRRELLQQHSCLIS